MRLKKALAALAITIVPQIGTSANFTNFIEKYATPCGFSLAVGMAGSSLINSSSSQGFGAGLMGCSLLIIGGETVATKDTLSNEQIKKMDEIISSQLDQNRKSLRKDYDDQISFLREKISSESVKNKEVVKNVIGNIAVMMEEEIMKKIQARIKTMDVVPELRDEMKAEIKAEVIQEIKSRNVDFEDEIVQKIIDRVVVENFHLKQGETFKTRTSK